MNQIVPAGKRPGTELAAPETQDYVTMFIDGQMFGIQVLTVQDVLGPQKITRIPLAPREVAGSLNLRGRIVTAVDVRLRLGLRNAAEDNKGMSVVVDQNGELYSLMVDQVGEVLSLPAAKFERNPPTLDPMWREFSAGIYRLEDKLMVVLDVGKLLDFKKDE
ncbi:MULTISPECIES: chemotaxis protein CheW [Magnetospirillum]|uniref:Chemotaxis protein CheW n=1 Tax=Magnetospirillum moscoviense TaxID=1437059 RepID=A0A178MUC5_9PROT|nr:MULTISPECIES: chemotaxis protein CheW [Magnetospirillum]OAN53241.1 chemotaxis protein CheW [Magnetospirillum moscoviense]CAA7618024.1 CheW-like protein [Magnetospirillum sp. LM-5]